MIILTLFFFLVAFLIMLRYRLHIKGLDECYKGGDKGILFLPNHPALIDPVILSRVLFLKFHPRALVDEKQIRQNLFLRYFEKSLRILPLPDMGIAGKAGLEKVIHQIDACAEALKNGDNLIMYPAGRIYRSKLEKLRGNGGVAKILELYPEVRIVLVRTRGLWGSSFGRAKGYQEPFVKVLKSHIKHLLLNLLFLVPKRDVSIEFVELPADFPKHGTKEEMNRYLEAFYNENTCSNTYVPYYWWEKGGARVVPEPDVINNAVDTSEVPESVRKTVYAKLHEMTPKRTLQESYTLGTDLGLDSLAVADLQGWLQETFGHQVNNVETLQTVANVLMAAIGQSASSEPLRPIPPEWFVKENPTLIGIPENAKTVTGAFLELAKRDPNFVLVADQTTGVITNRKMVLATMVLKDVIARLPGDRIGLLMPSCAPAFIVYMSILFAGKIPVMINWTVGPRNMENCIRNSGIKHILTSKVVIERLEGRGTDFSVARDLFVYLEDLKKEISLFHKLACLVKSRVCWSSLRNAPVPKYAAILFTSGSESMPKTVPLTHWNVITDIRSAMDALGLRADDCMIGMLPPFHSFGLLIDFLMPACANLRVAYHTNPTEGNMLARLIAAYHVTMIVGTPTFASYIMKNATPAQLQSVRILITGAEKCPDATFKMFFEMCPNASFLEGYGITECSPIVALNRPAIAIPGSAGLMLDCLEWMICDKENKPLPPGNTGMLFVRGPSVFEGYLNYDGPSPFVTINGKEWYRTGDLVQANEQGIVFFKGRLKRFVKVGGEMVSLPAIEEVLMDHYRSEDIPLPLAIEAQGTDTMPEIILFTVLELDRSAVNTQIREAGMSPIHYVKRIVKLKEIPILGSGKTDYQTLKKMKLEEEA